MRNRRKERKSESKEGGNPATVLETLLDRSLCGEKFSEKIKKETHALSPLSILSLRSSRLIGSKIHGRGRRRDDAPLK